MKLSARNQIMGKVYRPSKNRPPTIAETDLTHRFLPLYPMRLDWVCVFCAC
jgi:hypothetical protein